MQKFKIKKGDVVLVLSGKDAGKKGKVLRRIDKTSRVVVEGINIIKKHARPTQKFQGGIIERPNAIPISKVQLVCTRCGKASRVGMTDGKRVCKKCGEVVDKV